MQKTQIFIGKLTGAAFDTSRTGTCQPLDDSNGFTLRYVLHSPVTDPPIGNDI